MKESQFGFSYSWSDLQPIRALSVTVVIGQIIGAAIGYKFPHFTDWFQNLWLGGALMTFPAFLCGLIVQSKSRPEAINENIVMVRRLGLIALLLGAFALAMIFLDNGH